MRIRMCFVAAFLLIGQSAVGAQTTRDGIDAWARGEFGRAAEIFQPLAEPGQPDPAAAFFLGTMYETGSGVPRDLIRACALYQRVESTRHLLFDQMATGRMQALRETLDIKQLEECDLRASIGFDHSFQRLTFTLGPGHSVTVDVTGATIAYDGRESHVDVYPSIPGVIFLPVRYTELTAGPRASKRHFLEFFTWEPNPRQGAWMLNWLLFEVIRDDLHPAAGEILTTATSPQPPSDLDISDMTTVRVNAAGDVEWAILNPDPRSEIILTEAEKIEAERQSQARAAAERAVDWTRVFDPYRTPTLNYADANGCGHVFLFGWSGDRGEIITVSADKDLLQLSTVPRTFDIASQPPGLEVMVHVFENLRRPWPPFCNDVGVREAPPERWRAISGTVTIELSTPGVNKRAPFMYRATVRITGAEFVNATGGRTRQTVPLTLTAVVGFVMG